MNRLFAPLLLVATLTGLFLSGCSSSSRIIANGLGITVTAIEPQTDGTAKISWQVDNTNIVAYLLSELDLKLTVNGQFLGKIEERSPLAVPQTSNAGRTSTINLSAEAARALTRASGKPANYEVTAKIIILLYGEETEKSYLSNHGSVVIK